MLASDAGTQITGIHRAYKEKPNDYLHHDILGKDLKSLLIASLDEEFIRSFCYKCTRHTHVDALQMTAHLCDTSTWITVNALKENVK